MAACRIQCRECGTAFYGRADARYCCPACRQKAHRARARQRAAYEAVPAPDLSSVRTRVREVRERAASGTVAG